MLATALAAISHSSFSDVERITLGVIAATAAGVALAAVWLRRSTRPRFAAWMTTITPGVWLAGVLLTILVAAVAETRYEGATRSIGCGLGLVAGTFTAWLLSPPNTVLGGSDLATAPGSPGPSATDAGLTGSQSGPGPVRGLSARPWRAASGVMCATIGPMVLVAAGLALTADRFAAVATPSLALGFVAAVLTLLRSAEAAIVSGLAGGIAAAVLVGDVAWGSGGVLFALLATLGVVAAVLLTALIAAGGRRQHQSARRQVVALAAGAVTVVSCAVLAAQTCLPATFVHLVGVTADPVAVVAAAITAGTAAGVGVLLTMLFSSPGRGVVARRRRSWQLGAGLGVVLAVAQGVSQGSSEVSFLAVAGAGSGLLAAVALGAVVFLPRPTSENTSMRRSLGPLAVAALALQGTAVAASVVLDGVNEAGVSLFGFPALFAVAAPSVLLGLLAGAVAPDMAARWRRPGGLAEPSAMLVGVVAIVAVIGLLGGFGAAIGCAVGLLLRATMTLTHGAWRRPSDRVHDQVTVLAVVVVAVWHVAQVTVLLHGPFGAGMLARWGWAVAVVTFSAAVLWWWPGGAASDDLTVTPAAGQEADDDPSATRQQDSPVASSQQADTDQPSSAPVATTGRTVDVTDAAVAEPAAPMSNSAAGDDRKTSEPATSAPREAVAEAAAAAGDVTVLTSTAESAGPKHGPAANTAQAGRPTVRTDHIITEPHLQVDVDHTLGVQVTPQGPSQPASGPPQNTGGRRGRSDSGPRQEATEIVGETPDDSPESDPAADHTDGAGTAQPGDGQHAADAPTASGAGFLPDDSAEHHALLQQASDHARMLAIRSRALAAGREAAGLEKKLPTIVSAATIDQSHQDAAQVGDAADLMATDQENLQNASSASELTTNRVSSTESDGQHVPGQPSRQQSTPEVTIDHDVEISTDTVAVVATPLSQPRATGSSTQEPTESPTADDTITVQHGAVVTVEDPVTDYRTNIPGGATTAPPVDQTPQPPMAKPAGTTTPPTDQSDGADHVDVTDSDTLLAGFSTGVVSLLPEEATDSSEKTHG